MLHLEKIDRSIHYIPWYSDTQGLMNIEHLKEINGKLQDKFYFLCGPFSMMEFLVKELTQNGVKNSHIITEDFNLFD
jgi:ferredoxin-NADP reductase